MHYWTYGALTICLGVASACSSGSSGESAAAPGAGGSGGSNPGATSSSKPSTSSTETTISSASGGGSAAAMTCDSIGVCRDTSMTLDMNYDNDCLSCRIAGTAHSDGRACEKDYVACFGPKGDCAGGSMDCCGLGKCVAACPPTDITCICSSADGKTCDKTQTDAKTCFGKYPDGTAAYADLIVCMFSGCMESCKAGG